MDRAIMNAVSQWWIGGLRTRKAKVAGSILAGGSENKTIRGNICLTNSRSKIASGKLVLFALIGDFYHLILEISWYM